VCFPRASLRPRSKIHRRRRDGTAAALAGAG
jgi:hypothetical protein